MATEWPPHGVFSTPQETVEAAQALHTYGLFNCAAVFETPDGTFVYGKIRETSSPPYATARSMQDAGGYKMVSYHGALLDVWLPFPPAIQERNKEQ